MSKTIDKKKINKKSNFLNKFTIENDKTHGEMIKLYAE